MNDKDRPEEVSEEVLESERWEALHQIEEFLEMPVLVLGFVWLVLLVVELIWGLNAFLNTVVLVIWGIFIVDFALRFVLAPKKIPYLKTNWLTALSLALPALRVFRVVRVFRLFRLARATRSLRLVKVVASLNRGMRSLRATMGRRGFGYVALLSLVIVFVGAAGMFAFERTGPAGEGFESYSDALWWTAMILTTLGSEFWPRTGEGRVLAVLLSLYGFAVFGYVTATLASFFVGRDAEEEEGELADKKSIEQLRAEIIELHAEIRTLLAELEEKNFPSSPG